MSDPEGPRCQGYDNVKDLQCAETRTKLYYLPGKPTPALQKRWFCQKHGTIISPTGGGIWNPKTEKLEHQVTWNGSDMLIEKIPQSAELKITKIKKTRASKPSSG